MVLAQLVCRQRWRIVDTLAGPGAIPIRQGGEAACSTADTHSEWTVTTREDAIKDWHDAHNRLREVGNKYFPLVHQRGRTAASEAVTARNEMLAAKERLDEAFQRVLRLSEDGEDLPK